MIYPTANNRINWVDYFKAFSILLIVLGHSILKNVQFLYFLYLFNVPLFFFISGFLEKTSKCDVKQYLQKTTYSLIIPYFLWNLLCVIYHWPLTIKKFCSLIFGLSIWNAASWFLGVLVIIKIVALLLRNRNYLLAISSLSILFILFYFDHRMPYFANLAFLFMPFFFVGMYGKSYINLFVSQFEHKPLINCLLSIGGVFLLMIIFSKTKIPHTIAVVSFTNYYYLYWLSGFLGIFSMFFLCICFNKRGIGLIQAISVATLFIMCSHYEILQRTTGQLSNIFGDIVCIIVVILFFLLQCIFIPIVLKYVPILAGRGDFKVLFHTLKGIFKFR